MPFNLVCDWGDAVAVRSKMGTVGNSYFKFWISLYAGLKFSHSITRWASSTANKDSAFFSARALTRAFRSGLLSHSGVTKITFPGCLPERLYLLAPCLFEQNPGKQKEYPSPEDYGNDLPLD